ncbi:hypothetical protein [Nocardioides sp. LML1-1-1.1]|uniref:hypothetical protein n=1 Tax=Nocardioides sp. LML1-1-1.1 TaxID=3135248 RepID=UPI00341C5FAA
MKRWVDEWMMFALCVLYLGVSVVVVPFAISAARNEGTFGTFTAVEKDCGRDGCDWTGTFVSDDGSIRMDDASFDSEELDEPGDQARAQKVAGDNSLYSRGSKGWILFVAGDVFCLGYVGWRIRKTWLRRRVVAEEPAA